MAETTSQLHPFWSEIKDTVRLNLDYAKLTAAEKATILLSTIALALVAFVALSSVIFFISLGLVILLAKSTGLFGASMIMAGIYVVFLAVAIVLRKQLIIDPIAKFISHLILNKD